MKRKITYLAGTFFIVAGISVFSYFKKDGISKYKQSGELKIENGKDDDNDAREANGAAQWWFDRTKNQVTGQLDFDEIYRIQNLASQTLASASTQRNSNPSSVASVQWNELGPDNVGGRTRAIHWDNQDPTHQHMFAGGVSGGLWESPDGGNNWHKCAGFFSPTIFSTVVTIAQAIDGTLYVGTGEGNFYFAMGIGAGGFIGGGIYKSTDDGASWNLLASTSPTANNNSIAWANVNKIQCDPADAQHIYAGTNKGFKESHDGGVTWTTPNGITSATALCTDVEVSQGGHVIAIINAKPWLSLDHGATFSNVGTSAQGFTNAGLGLTTVAIAPSDENYVYCLCATNAGAMYGVYASTNGGQNWTQVCGAGNQQFDPIGPQGTYANAIAVDPSNKQHMICGGLDLWEWDMITTNPIAGQWTQLSEWFYNIFNPIYVHADIHEIKFHPTNAGTFFVGCDGGIFRTTNGGTYFNAMNSGYNVTQCYAVAFDHNAGNRKVAMAGCQDNGTNYIDGTGNTAMSSKEVGGGDGAWCDLSYLNQQALFSTVYYGALVRSANNGGSSSQFYDTRLQNEINAGLTASFVTPERLWESTNDMLSGDTVRIANTTNVQNKNITNGDSAHYTGTLSITYPTASPSATIVLSSVMFVAGNDTLVSNASGVISGDGTGTVTTSGNYSILFNTTPPNNVVVKAIFDAQYSAGTVFTVNSNVQGKLIPPYTTTTQVNPGDTIKIQDIIQAHLVVGFTGAVWMTRRAIDFSVTPDWIKIGGSHSTPNAYGGECSCVAWSPDGDNLYAGTSSGNVYRFSHVGSITDSINGGVDNGASANPNCQVTCTLIGQWGGRDVTAIDVNPNNQNEVIVSLGNYGNTAYIYYTTTATTATGFLGTFTDKTGNLDNIGGVPVYSVTFDKYSVNRILAGTEHGVFETANITAGAPSWSSANAGMDNVPVDMIRQQRWDPWLVPNAGCFYIGTHGRGMWRDDSSWQQPNGINSPSSPSSENNFINNHDLRVFPNPVIDNSHVAFTLGKSGDAQLQIYDLSGKLVYSHKYEQLNAGANTVEFEAQDLVKGTYIIVVNQDEKQVGSGRFVKMN